MQGKQAKEKHVELSKWRLMESLLSFLAFALCQFAGLHTRCSCIFYSLNFPDTGNLTSQMWPLRSQKGHSLATSHLLSTREKGDTYFLCVWFKKKKKRNVSWKLWASGPSPWGEMLWLLWLLSWGKGQAHVAECHSISSSRSSHTALSIPHGRSRAVPGAGGYV